MNSNLYVVFHQVMFLLTGLGTTLGTQWIFYHGAATGNSYLTQLTQYVGMMLVGLLIPTLKKRKEKSYKKIPQEENETIQMSPINSEEAKDGGFQEGPINHISIIKLTFLDIVANFSITWGFSVIGSGVKLNYMQWLAIFGTSAGLAFSSLDSMNGGGSGGGKLMLGNLMTLIGTFLYACLYVYSDYIISQTNPPPLPARVCFYSGVYNVIFAAFWIGIYTVPSDHIQCFTLLELL
ncbi:hypothetical protein BY458DRAFT_500264 [Sporodiniella umbellata]|nr:hypothetical protein BY458DRAFT_500264 [Sporodiniella umbellata]